MQSTCTQYSIEYWRNNCVNRDCALLDDLEQGKIHPDCTLKWDFNYINIAIALDKFRALEIIFQAHGVDEGLSLRERIAMIVLLQPEGL